MIERFRDRRTEDIFDGVSSKKAQSFPANLRASAIRKLDLIDAATALKDLKSPPGNNLEPLKGELAGFYSIRINRQWRIIFSWNDGGAHNVQIVDYH